MFQKPILKWTGGKSSEIPDLLPYFPKELNNFLDKNSKDFKNKDFSFRYIEPFVGGGSMLFYLNGFAKSSFVNDFNSELISFYQYIKNENTPNKETIEKNDKFSFYLNDFNLDNSCFISQLTQLIEFWEELQNLSAVDLNLLYSNGLKILRSKGSEDENRLINGVDLYIANNFNIPLFFKFNKTPQSWNKLIYEDVRWIETGKYPSLFLYFFLKEIKRKEKLLHQYDQDPLLNEDDYNTKEFIKILRTCVLASFYYICREHYNNLNNQRNLFWYRRYKINSHKLSPLHISCWFFMRELGYSGMFRYSSKGDFNVPFGGQSYATKNLRNKLDYILTLNPSLKSTENELDNIKISEKLEFLEIENDKNYHMVSFIKKENYNKNVSVSKNKINRCFNVDNNSNYFHNIEFYNQDYKDFFKNNHCCSNIKEKIGFIFIDPPYDTNFSQYNRESDFSKENQVELRNLLMKIIDEDISNKLRIMLVIKETDFIRELYEGKIKEEKDKLSRYFYIYDFNKQYSVNIKNRNNDKKVKHLVITNYLVK